jgi:hypothetical protein
LIEGRAVLRIMITVVAMGAALLLTTVPANAASVQPTSIQGFAASVTTMTYQQPVTFSGELVEGAAKTPVANEPVQLQFQPLCVGQFASAATGQTGSDGQFTIATTLPSGGCARAAFAGDTGLGASISSPWWGIGLSVTHLPSRLVLDPVPRSVPAGTPVTFSGTMQVQVNGTWQPFPGQPLALTMEPYTSSQPNARYATTSGTDGRFSLTEPLSETSAWSVDTSLNGSYWESWFPDWASASFNWIYGVSKTRITGFSIPARDEAHYAYSKGLPATGTVDRWNGSSWVGLAFGWVQLYYRPEGSKTWRKDVSTETDAYGNFKNGVVIHLGTSDWQARVVRAPDTLPSISTNTVTSTITDRTHFASAGISRSSSGSSVYGQVTDWRNGQPTFSTLRGLKLRLYYRADGSRTWHAYKTAKVQASGFFQFFVAKSYGYRFKVVLPAQGPFLSCTSRIL